jgi:hypothetical protein
VAEAVNVTFCEGPGARLNELGDAAAEGDRPVRETLTGQLKPFMPLIETVSVVESPGTRDKLVWSAEMEKS